MRKIAVCLILLSFSILIPADCVFQTTDRSEADLVVFIASDRSEADRIVCVKNDCSEAVGSDKWAFVDDRSEADTVIYVTKERSEADEVIYLEDECVPGAKAWQIVKSY